MKGWLGRMRVCANSYCAPALQCPSGNALENHLLCLPLPARPPAHPPTCLEQAALEKVKEMGRTPRLAPGDYGSLVRVLKKILAKDSIVPVAVAAAEVAAVLASGLRDSFSGHAKVRLPQACLPFRAVFLFRYRGVGHWQGCHTDAMPVGYAGDTVGMYCLPCVTYFSCSSSAKCWPGPFMP